MTEHNKEDSLHKSVRAGEFQNQTVDSLTKPKDNARHYTVKF
jgi:hypothetical protein